MTNGDPLGPVFRTPQEKARETGGFVSVTDPGTPGVFDPGVAARTRRRGGGGGGGGRGRGSIAESLAAGRARTLAAQIEQQRLVQLAIDKQIAADKAAVLAREREQVRQERIFAGTLAGQIGARGRTPEELRTEITEKVRERSRAETLFPRISKALTSEELGSRFIGIGVPGTQTFISGRQISRGLPRVTGFLGGVAAVGAPEIIKGEVPRKFETGVQRGQFGGKVVTEFIPKTAGESIILGGVAAIPFIAPPLVTTGVSLGFGALGAKQALDPSLALEQRVAGGLVGVGGLAGGAFGVAPFARGARARISGGVRIAERGFEFVSDVKGVGDIGLIQPGPKIFTGFKGKTIVFLKGQSADLPKTSPLKRGGFGVRPGEKKLFLGKDQTLATSQIGFFEVGREIKIEREFFVTPQEPTLKIAETRISRLGLVEPFKRPRDVELGFGLPGRPQIGIIREGVVARVETPTGFKIGRGTELEAIKTTGRITSVQRLGERAIKGQAVDIFEFRIGEGGRRPGRISRGRGVRTTEGITRVTGETTITTALSRGIAPTRGISTGLTRTLGQTISQGITGITTPGITISLPTRTDLGPTAPTTPTTGISPLLLPPSIPVGPPSLPLLDFELPIISRVRKRKLKEKPRKKIKKKKVTKKRKTPIRPSFTAIVAELEGGLPEETTIGGIDIGILPTRLRRL